MQRNLIKKIFPLKYLVKCQIIWDIGNTELILYYTVSYILLKGEWRLDG